MCQEYDLVTELQEKISEFINNHNQTPETIILSPSAFEWLVAIFSEVQKVLGVSPINFEAQTYSTHQLHLHLSIDEAQNDFEIRVN